MIYSFCNFLQTAWQFNFQFHEMRPRTLEQRTFMAHGAAHSRGETQNFDGLLTSRVFAHRVKSLAGKLVQNREK